MTSKAFSAVMLDSIADAIPDFDPQEVLESSLLIQYLREKTKSADSGSKARGSFANLYAIYVLVEDYVSHSFHVSGEYSDYEGAQFSRIFARQRELPFGDKLQNHGLNSRCNEEFAKYFPKSKFRPIIRDLATKRYWINENLLNINIRGETVNIAGAVLDVIDKYVEAKRDAFDSFIQDCDRILEVSAQDPRQAAVFIEGLLRPNVDARIFEIASFAILRAHFAGESVWFGDSLDSVSEHSLRLFKTGRTNANDGGIDFVMRPLGRFFQVTETADVRKYFLDIEKVQRFPISFVVKTEDSAQSVIERIRKHAQEIYAITRVVDKYMDSVEEVFTLNELRTALAQLSEDKRMSEVITELRTQAYVEFNIDPEGD